MIYADHAATTQLSRTALNAMLPAMETAFGNPSGVYRLAQQAKAMTEDARARIADCLHASAKEIWFTSGGSESDNQALRTAAAYGAANGKRHIVSAAFEHHAVLHTLDALKQEGYTVTLLDLPENGILSAEQVEAAIRPDTAFVSVMYANNEIGTIQPIAEIGRICREKQILFHTDAVQAAGHLPIDVTAQYIDLLSLSAHKFYGPKGCGILYARKGITPAPLIYGGAQERGRRAGTENVPAIVGTAAALEESVSQMETEASRLSRLRDMLIAGLSAIPQSMLNGDAVNRLPSNVNFSFAGIAGEELLMLLDAKGICASSGSACASGSLDPSHVLLAIGRTPQLARGALRLTIGRSTTEADIAYMIEAVQESVQQLRQVHGGI